MSHALTHKCMCTQIACTHYCSLVETATPPPLPLSQKKQQWCTHNHTWRGCGCLFTIEMAYFHDGAYQAFSLCQHSQTLKHTCECTKWPHPPTQAITQQGHWPVCTHLESRQRYICKWRHSNQAPGSWKHLRWLTRSHNLQLRTFIYFDLPCTAYAHGIWG